MEPEKILKIAKALRDDLKAAIKAGRGPNAPLSLIIDDLQRRYAGYRPKYAALGRILSQYVEILHIPLSGNPSVRHEWIKENLENLRKGYAPELSSLLVFHLWDDRPDFLTECISQVGDDFRGSLPNITSPLPSNLGSPSQPMSMNYPANFGFNIRDWEIAGQRIARERSQRSGHLSIAKLRIDCIPDAISDLEWIIRLNLSLLPISSIGSLSRLGKLEVFDCSYTKVSKLPDLANCRSLKMIFCGVSQIADLEAVASCREIERIHCGSTNISDLRPLRSCSQLMILHCEDTRVSELAGLEQSSNLRLLDCSDTPIKSLLPIERLPSLETLLLNGCNIEEHSANLWLSPALKEVTFFRGSLAGIPAHILSRSFDENCLPRIREYLGTSSPTQ